MNGIWYIFTSLADCFLGIWFDPSFLLQLLVVSAKKPIIQLLPLEELVVGNLGFVFRTAAGRRGPSSGSGRKGSGAPLPRRDKGSAPARPGRSEFLDQERASRGGEAGAPTRGARGCGPPGPRRGRGRRPPGKPRTSPSALEGAAISLTSRGGVPGKPQSSFEQEPATFRFWLEDF